MATGRTVTRSKNTLNAWAANLQPSSTKPIETIKDPEGDEAESPVDSSIEEQLAQAKSSRTQAESARQKIANEILEATKEVCQKLIADGEQTLERAKKLEAEAMRKEREAQEQLNQAAIVKADSDSYRDRVIVEAKEQGQQILYLSRSAAEQECNEMKHHANLDAQRKMAEAQLVKAAVLEELEAQKIYAEAARLETESLGVLAQVRAKLADPSGFLGQGSELEIPTVQLNAAQASNTYGETPVPAVEPNSVIPDSVIPDSVMPDSVIPDSVIPDSVMLNSAEPKPAAKKSAAPARKRRSSSPAK